jgi:hypothetical protein
MTELRDDAGILSADAIQKTFGFDTVNFGDLSRDGFQYPTSFDQMIYEQGCDLLIRLVQAVVRKIDPNRTQPEDDVTQAMLNFMNDTTAGPSRSLRVRQGEAILILEEIYGGVARASSFMSATKRKDDIHIGAWLGFDQSELGAIARVNSLGLLEAVASTQKENGRDLSGLKPLYSTQAAYMSGNGALRELSDINFMLFRKGLREDNDSNFGRSETVYRRPVND